MFRRIFLAGKPLCGHHFVSRSLLSCLSVVFGQSLTLNSVRAAKFA